ncbi:hypothetical protein DFP72DRAFT_160601 [Ephemerocybe angulata]|uniref:Uncharacterized protein n=1 Tax=Ephemerocybe angulata TaxID=980116 RepID=A0A8H6MC82_9AGAR|nr:hypothetical protein DFP72DRAFT_160601 [Tulosesus angulatus]
MHHTHRLRPHSALEPRYCPRHHLNLPIHHHLDVLDAAASTASYPSTTSSPSSPSSCPFGRATQTATNLPRSSKRGEGWRAKFTRGARMRRGRSSSAASTASVASGVVFVGSSVLAGGTVATPKAPPATVVHPPSTGAGVASTNQATAVPVSVKRTALSTSTSTATLSSHAAEETNEHEHDVDVDVNDQTEPEGPESANEEDGEPITCGKLTRAVVDEVEGLKRRSASGTSMSKLVIRSASTNVKAAAGVAVPLPTSCSSSESLPTSTGIAKPSSTRAFLDVPQHTRGFHVHERVASGGSMNSVSSSGSNGSGGNGSGNESAGSAGSTRSRGSAGSGGSQRVPGKSILKNASPLPSPVRSTFGSSVPSTPDGKFDVRSKRHSYSGTPRSSKEREAMKEMEKRRERQESEVVMVNTLMNMNIGSKDKTRRSRNGGSPKNGSAPSPLNSPRTIDLGGKKKGLCGDDYFGPCSGKEEDDDEDGLFPLPRASPGGSPNGTPGTGNTPRASAHTTPRGSNTPTPRGGSPRVSPRPSPRVSPRGSPPSPLAVVPPIKGEVLAVQGEVEGEVIKGSITRHVRTASEPMSLRGHEFPRAPPVKESKSSASVASSPARPRPKPQRKTSNSFSAIGRNLRALKGVGADMVKGLGNMGGMAGGPGY